VKLNVLDLFSGIGGFSVGLERTGNFETVAFCEIDKYCKLLLQKHWKGVKIYDDVKKITKEGLKADGIESPDVITGGVPCQPFSVAGKQKGTSDDRHLWPEMFRIIKAFKSRFVIVENVRGLINIQDGVVFETVCTDLESEGYEVQPFIIPAAGVGAPHRRERVWIIAIREESMVNSEHNGSPTSTIEGSSAASSDNNEKGQIKTSEFEGTSGSRNDEAVADTNESNSREGKISGNLNNEGRRASETRRESLQSEDRQTCTDNLGSGSEDVADTITGNAQTGRERQREIRKGHQEEGVSDHVARSSEAVANTRSERLEGQLRSKLQGTRERFTNSSERSSDASNTDRTGSQRLGSEHELRNSEEEKQTRRIGWWDVEPDVGRVAHGVSGRVHRLKGLGNAIVPQIAEEIGRAIIKAME